MNFESILNNLITSGVELSDPDILRRFKVLNIFQLVVIMLAPVLGLFYFYIGAIPLFYVMIITGLLMIGGIILLRKTKNMVLAGNYAVFILWAAISIISWNTGAITPEGIINPSWILSVGLILLAVFLNGYLSGTVWVMIVFIQTGVIIHLYRARHLFPNLIPPEISATYFMGTYLICILFILLFAFLFERDKIEALMREQEKSRTIRDAKRYMDDVFDRYPLPTFVLDKNHRVIQWNRACQEVSGISPEEILGKEVWEGFHIDDKSSIADIIIRDVDSIKESYGNSIISGSDSGWFEMNTYLPKLRNGQRAVITVAPILDNSGVVMGAIQTTKEIRKSSFGGGIPDYLDEGFPKPVFRVDSKGMINFWNKACEKTFGYTSSQMLGKNALTLVAKGYRPNFDDTINKALKGESFPKQEWRYQSREGKPIYVMARVFPSPSAVGHDMECVIVNTDTTTLRLNLKKLTRYAAESNEKFKNLTEEYNLLKKNIATFIRKKDDQKNS